MFFRCTRTISISSYFAWLIYLKTAVEMPACVRQYVSLKIFLYCYFYHLFFVALFHLIFIVSIRVLFLRIRIFIMLNHVVRFESCRNFLRLGISIFGNRFRFLFLSFVGSAFGKILHFHSYILLYYFKSGRVDELREWIQLFLIKKSQEIIAESSHFTISVRHQVLKNSRRKRNYDTSLFNF